MCSPLQCIVLPPGTLRGVCPCLWSRGPATAEAPRRLRSRGSHIDLADRLEMGSPYIHLYSPCLALSQGESLSCSSSPLSESALICSSFSPRRFICFVLSGSRVADLARSVVSCRSPASGHRASRSKYTRDQSRETGSLSRPPGSLGAPAKRVSLGSAWADSGS